MITKILTLLLLRLFPLLSPNFLTIPMLAFFTAGIALPDCQPEDFHFEFTECDQKGGRWRVYVPKNPNACTVNTVNEEGHGSPPIRVTSCSTSCESGYFFNPEKLSCEPCPAGTYSLGGGISFDSWDELPEGFYVSEEPLMHSNFKELNSQRGNTTLNCSMYSWQPRGEFIASQAGPCSSTLTYSVKLVKDGNIDFSYQYTDGAIFFQFLVQNDQCQSIEETGINKLLPMTKEGEWKEVAAPLKAGLNVLHWKTVGISVDPERRNNPVLLKKMEIHGVAFTSTCSVCPNGTFSSEGAKSCSPCPENTYSGKGASACLKCLETEYSGNGSNACYMRPPCSDKDYYQVQSPCDENKKMQVTYKWVEPKICRDDVSTAVQLPVVKKKKPCPPCNPGMEYNNTSCNFCLVNYYSDGHGSCKQCSPSTVPNYHYNYTYWNSWPPNIVSLCVSFNADNGCRSSKGWQIAGDHIHTVKRQDVSAYLVLSLEVPGFRSNGGIVNGKPMEIAEISFEFELHCSSSCELSFMQGINNIGVSVIQTWNGTQPRKKFAFPITRNESYIFRWIFQKVTWDQQNLNEGLSTQFANDEAKIYSIYISNTLDGGAEMCIPCHQGVTSDGCIPCPPGHYINRNTTTCSKCPPDTYVSDPFALGPESCQRCGPGLRSSDGQNCFNDCTLDIDQTHFDFSSLKGHHIIKGTHLFTTSGTQYYHLFNLSLCGEHIIDKTNCYNNVSYHSSSMETGEVSSILCRSTIIPPKLPGEIALSTQSLSLGDDLLAVTSEPVFGNIKIPKELLESKEGIALLRNITSSELQNAHKIPQKTTRACQLGRSSTITLRCDTTQDENGTIQLPHSCPDGTCDGCSFHFLWLTRNACPTCSESDFEIVKGECINSEQIVHYIPPKHCLLPSWADQPSNKIHKCSSVPKELKIIIIVAVVVGSLLLMLVIYFWKKNRKLEYKYMKLVHSSNSKDGELPPAESCAIDDEEEDHFDSIQFKESRSKKILNMIRSMTGPKLSDEEVMMPISGNFGKGRRIFPQTWL